MLSGTFCDPAWRPPGGTMAVTRKAKAVKFAELTVPTEELLRYYRDMLLIRRFEERAGQMYGMGLIGGFCHLYIGQEAVVVGMQAALEEGDTVITSYRDHGHMLAAGMDPKGVMAELTGRRGGYSHGMGTSVARASARTDLYHRGTAYGIAGEQVDGMDVVAVYEAGKGAAERVRRGDGPAILEMLTYRYRGHSMSDPAKYRTKEEVNRMRTEHDPIDHLRQRLIDSGAADEGELKELERRVRERVVEAAQFAQESPEPDPSELWTDVLAEA